jgi:hypothetical protein
MLAVSCDLNNTSSIFIPPGTFGQNHPWDVFTPDSWGHPRVPFEILTDPRSMPTHRVLETDVPAGCLEGRQEQDHGTEEKDPCEVGV